MVEPRLMPGFAVILRLWGSVLVGQRLMSGLLGLALVGGQIAMCLVRLFGSPTVAAWSKGMDGGRAKTFKGAEDLSGNLLGGAQK